MLNVRTKRTKDGNGRMIIIKASDDKFDVVRKWIKSIEIDAETASEEYQLHLEVEAVIAGEIDG